MSRFEVVANSNPINRLASQVTAKGEERPKIEIPENIEMFEAPPKTWNYLGPKHLDLTGQRIKRMIVYGYWDSKKFKSDSCYWVMRCDCGLFQVMSSRKIREHARGDKQGMLQCYCCIQIDAIKLKLKQPTSKRAMKRRLREMERKKLQEILQGNPECEKTSQ